MIIIFYYSQMVDERENARRKKDFVKSKNIDTLEVMRAATVMLVKNIDTTKFVDTTIASRAMVLYKKASDTIYVVMSNSFGFGGTNASLVFREFQEKR